MVSPLIKKIIFAVVVVLCIIGFSAYKLTPKYMFASSFEHCEKLYPVGISSSTTAYDLLESAGKLSECKVKVQKGETLFTSSKKIEDKNCESETRALRTTCYFKKALDTKDYRYCLSIYNSDYCIRNLATFVHDDSICQYSAQKSTCEENVETCKTQTGENKSDECMFNEMITCDSLFPRNVDYLDECMEKYGLTNIESLKNR